MNQFRHPRLSVKLGLVVLAIVAGALGIVYAAVVPRLEDRLVDDRLDALTATEVLNDPVVRQAFQLSVFPPTGGEVARGQVDRNGERAEVAFRLRDETV